MRARHAMPCSRTWSTIIALAVVDKDARGTVVDAQTPVGLVTPCARRPGRGEGHGHDAEPEAHAFLPRAVRERPRLGGRGGGPHEGRPSPARSRSGTPGTLRGRRRSQPG